MTIDHDKLNAFMGKFVTDMGATAHAATVLTGEKLGLYKAMAKHGPMTSAEMAKNTGYAERYVREWLNAQAASGYCEYDPNTKKFHLTPEQAYALADETSAAYIPGAYHVLTAIFNDEPKVCEAFKSGKGIGWHEHHHGLFEGTAKFFRPGYAANLVSNWLPALEGVVPKLEKGAKIADVGCGYGITTVLMGQRFPNSEVVGYDIHAPSIEAAKKEAKAAGVKNVRFEVAASKDFPGRDFDLVTFFDCLHDMGDPVGASAHVHNALKPDGTWMIVEPFAGDKLEDNINPVGRIYYAASLNICCPASLSQEVGMALGAQAGEARLREVITKGGFKSVKRATQTPFNLILEARK